MRRRRRTGAGAEHGTDATPAAGRCARRRARAWPACASLAPETREARSRVSWMRWMQLFMVMRCLVPVRRARPVPRPKPRRPRGRARSAVRPVLPADPIRRALWLDALDQRLRPHLPPSLAAHARLANVNGAQAGVSRRFAGVAARACGSPLRNCSTPPDPSGSMSREVVIRTATRSPDPGTASPRAALPMSAAAREALEAALSSLSRARCDRGRKTTRPDAPNWRPRRCDDPA